MLGVISIESLNDIESFKLIIDLINANPGENYKTIRFLESSTPYASGGSHYKSQHARTKHVKSQHAKTKNTKSQHARTKHVKSQHAKTKNTKSQHAKTKNTKSQHARTKHVKNKI
jgi:hypothetical protein